MKTPTPPSTSKGQSTLKRCSQGGFDAASPLVPDGLDGPARIFVDSPLPGPLSEGRVFLRYRTENIRVLPVFGEAALDVQPRIGHVHVTVDDAKWHFVDASLQTIVLVGLPPGQHRVLVELADPTHRVIDSQSVEFRIPEQVAPQRS